MNRSDASMSSASGPSPASPRNLVCIGGWCGRPWPTLFLLYAKPRSGTAPLGPVREFIDQILAEDRKAPRKQRHTAHRIYVRLGAERADHPIAERTVREYVQFWKLANGKSRGEIFIPQAYDSGLQAQVDWYEAVVELAGELRECGRPRKQSATAATELCSRVVLRARCSELPVDRTKS